MATVMDEQTRSIIQAHLDRLFADAGRCQHEEWTQKLRSSAPTPKLTLWRQLAEARYAAVAELARALGVDPLER